MLTDDPAGRERLLLLRQTCLDSPTDKNNIRKKFCSSIIVLTFKKKKE